ncbi:ABC transporter ATP-binding protein [Pseudolactococcus yaeyamensis]
MTLEIKHFSKKYKTKPIFLDSNFKAERGEIVVITGESGIGKTTFLEMISGLVPFQEGIYVYDETVLQQKSDFEMSRFRRDHIGYIAQDFALLEDYTVLENLLVPTFHQKKKKQDDINRARMLSKQFGFEAILKSVVKKISGGQKQRVAIARSLMLGPDIILADEPTTNLDKKNFEIIIALFQELKKDGKYVIIASHDERIVAIADKIYEISNFKFESVQKSGF